MNTTGLDQIVADLVKYDMNKLGKTDEHTRIKLTLEYENKTCNGIYRKLERLTKLGLIKRI